MANKAKDQLHDTIFATLQEKTTEELLEIWKENDTEAWSETAFFVTREILEARQVEIPPRTPPEEAPPAKKDKTPTLKKADKLSKIVLISFIILCISGCLTILTLHNRANGWTYGFGFLFICAFLTIGGILLVKWMENEGNPAVSTGPAVRKDIYLVILYTSEPPSSLELQQLTQGISSQEGRPVKVLEILQADRGMPTTPNEFVVTLCLLACDKHHIRFDANRDQILFRSGMGLGVATIRVFSR